MLHAKNYETGSTFVEVMQKQTWPLLFPGHGVYADIRGGSTASGVKRLWDCRRHFLAILMATSSGTLERRPTLSAVCKDQQESRAVAGKRLDAVVNSMRIEIYSGIARFSL